MQARCSLNKVHRRDMPHQTILLESCKPHQFNTQLEIVLQIKEYDLQEEATTSNKHPTITLIIKDNAENKRNQHAAAQNHSLRFALQDPLTLDLQHAQLLNSFECALYYINQFKDNSSLFYDLAVCKIFDGIKILKCDTEINIEDMHFNRAAAHYVSGAIERSGHISKLHFENVQQSEAAIVRICQAVRYRKSVKTLSLGLIGLHGLVAVIHLLNELPHLEVLNFQLEPLRSPSLIYHSSSALKALEKDPVALAKDVGTIVKGDNLLSRTLTTSSNTADIPIEDHSEKSTPLKRTSASAYDDKERKGSKAAYVDTTDDASDSANEKSLLKAAILALQLFLDAAEKNVQLTKAEVKCNFSPILERVVQKDLDLICQEHLRTTQQHLEREKTRMRIYDAAQKRGNYIPWSYEVPKKIADEQRMCHECLRPQLSYIVDAMTRGWYALEGFRRDREGMKENMPMDQIIRRDLTYLAEHIAKE